MRLDTMGGRPEPQQRGALQARPHGLHTRSKSPQQYPQGIVLLRAFRKGLAGGYAIHTLGVLVEIVKGYGIDG